MLRPVESGLGGHEEGVFGVDDMVENTSLSLLKLGRTAWPKRATFSDFGRFEKDRVSEKLNRKGVWTQRDMFALGHVIVCILSVQQDKNDGETSRPFCCRVRL